MGASGSMSILGCMVAPEHENRAMEMCVVIGDRNGSRRINLRVPSVVIIRVPEGDVKLQVF